MTRRKHISWKTKCAAAVLDAQLVRERFGLDPARWYRDAKEMTEDQFLSLFQWDHNILFSTEDPIVDVYWNLTPMLIREHREKTKADVKIIAKGRRIRKRQTLVELGHMLATAVKDQRATPSEAVAEALSEGFLRGIAAQKRKIQSRGFDKRFRRKMDGTVVKRKG